MYLSINPSIYQYVRESFRPRLSVRLPVDIQIVPIVEFRLAARQPAAAILSRLSSRNGINSWLLQRLLQLAETLWAGACCHLSDLELSASSVIQSWHGRGTLFFVMVVIRCVTVWRNRFRAIIKFELVHSSQTC